MTGVDRPPMRLGPRHELLVYLVGCLLVLSGAAWLIAHYAFAVKSEFGGEASPSEPLWLAFHGAAAMAALVVIGTLLPGHVSRAWKLKKNHRSGIAVLTIAALLAGTGYGLYYLGNENTRPIISLVHWTAGLIATAVLLTHVLLGKKMRRPRASNGRGDSGRGHRRSSNVEPIARLSVQLEDCGQATSGHPSREDVARADSISFERSPCQAAAGKAESEVTGAPYLLTVLFLLGLNIFFWQEVVHLFLRMSMIGTKHMLIR